MMKKQSENKLKNKTKPEPSNIRGPGLSRSYRSDSFNAPAAPSLAKYANFSSSVRAYDAIQKEKKSNSASSSDSSPRSGSDHSS